MIIVLEGPDCAGKTTLAHALIKASGDRTRYIHALRPEVQWPYATQILYQAVLNERAGLDTILDRHWISDNVYSYIDPSRGRSGIHVRRMESVLNRYGAFYILAAPDPRLCLAEYKKTHVERNELYGKRFTDVQRVMKLYRALWTGMQQPQPADDHPEQYTSQLTFTQPFCQRPLARNYDRFMVCDQQRWARDVWEVARVDTAWFREADPLRELRGKLDEEYLNLSGSLLSCKALLVGERAADPSRRCLWPFYSHKGSAAYLTRSLHRSLVPELDVAFVNAYSAYTQSTKPLSTVIEWISQHRPSARVVALGREAAHALEDVGCHDYVHVPHPQWARRFNHHGDYNVKLEAAIYGQQRALPHGPVGVSADLPATDGVRQKGRSARTARPGAGKLQLDLSGVRPVGEFRGEKALTRVHQGRASVVPPRGPRGPND